MMLKHLRNPIPKILGKNKSTWRDNFKFDLDTISQSIQIELTYTIIKHYEKIVRFVLIIKISKKLVYIRCSESHPAGISKLNNFITNFNFSQANAFAGSKRTVHSRI